ncbi:hypothetical protein Cgig2_002097 [Carnegiea gigantea]|uniref:PGG domain-containing protein n=1 Tax=Carnegiea gigantea TaxID=171969 RepID=A0A9Q1KVQ9_9CARY|nr:hypothetical protein Cgig2_002097 [Carnegiea gigantea]
MHWILSKDKTLVRLQDDEGSTPLHHAFVENKVEHLQILLSYKDGTNNESAAHIRDNEGRTPLHIAALQLSWECIDVLMMQYPDCAEIVDNNGQNVLHYVAKWACVKKLKYFVGVKYDFSKLMHDKDLDGNTPSHLLPNNLTHMLCNCDYRLSDFTMQQRYYFNNENLTGADIVASYQPVFEEENVEVVSRPKRIAKKSKIEGTRETLVVIQNWLVVAALVATVSFTAGFTVPGGFDQSPGPEIGTAIMTKNAAFKAFLISDALAFTFSSFAIFLFFVTSFTGKRVKVSLLTAFAGIFSIFSIGAMTVAFMTGVYVMIPHSRGLHIALFLVSALFFCFHAPYTLTLLCGGLWTAIKRGGCPDVPRRVQM